MTNLTDYSEKLLLDWMMTDGSATRPTAWFLALFSAAPGDSGGGTELAGNGYSRQEIAFAAAGTPGGQTSNTALVRFEPSGAEWGTITHFAIFTASSGGNMLWHGALTAERTVADGVPVEFAIGSITLTMA
jgi:hypothetical protein